MKPLSSQLRALTRTERAASSPPLIDSSLIVIVGAGGRGREAFDILEAMDRAWTFVGFLDDGAVRQDRLGRIDARVLGGTDLLGQLGAQYVIGIDSPSARFDIARRAKGIPAVTLVHPSATIGSDVIIDEGAVAAAGARIMTNVRIGCHTHLQANVVVGHDGTIGDYVTLSPGVMVGGEVEIDNGVFVGAGAVVLPGRRIGAGAIVAAGSVVARDVPAGRVVGGVPARTLSLVEPAAATIDLDAVRASA